MPIAKVRAALARTGFMTKIRTQAESVDQRSTEDRFRAAVAIVSKREYL